MKEAKLKCASAHELLKNCTRREQQKIKAIFFLLKTKKMRNIEKIFAITKSLIKQERREFVQKVKAKHQEQGGKQ